MLTFLSSDGTGIWSRGGKVRVTTAGRRLYVWLELAGRPASGLMIPMEASWKRADKNLHRLPCRLAWESASLSPALKSQLLASLNRFIGWQKRGTSETGRHVFQHKASEKWSEPKKQLTSKLETSCGCTKTVKAMLHGGSETTVEIRWNLLLERCRGEAFDMRLCEIFCCAN